MPRDNHRRRASGFERSRRSSQPRFNPYERSRPVSEGRSVTDEQDRDARETLRRILATIGQRANGPQAEEGTVLEQEARELMDSLMTIDQHRSQRLEQHLEQGRRESLQRQERRRRRRGRSDHTRSLQRFSTLRQMPGTIQQQLEELAVPPAPPNSIADMDLPSPLENFTTDMDLSLPPSADEAIDEQPTWEFEDWFDGEYLDQLMNDYLHLEGQELVQEVTRQVEQLNLADNLAQDR
ncbi:hypothetical protein CEP51_006721 [Fusarium floridanum]|uniref:Uncharacterized protein n=1 Tax=Fusarium floridanum TaxID=1325733 RepID=A0A428RRR2_9HYPO|nr:hypothetical protein CEP51_006721 [Fusarium floridanum]